MSDPVDLLLLTWNRRPYVEKTLAALLADPSDFLLHCWDNGSTDGAADIIASCDDPRVAAKRLSKENVMQGPPVRWFVENARTDVLGKIDDDTLMPPRWTEAIAPLVRGHDRVGMVGCWTFWPEDFENHKDAAMRKVVAVGEHRILQDFSIGGTGFLVRTELARKYFCKKTDGTWIPINRADLSLDGYISGWYFPLIWSEHMDDPRSEHNLAKQPGFNQEFRGLTVKTHSRSQDDYLQWIKDDAARKLNTSIDEQIRQFKAERRRPSLVRRLKAKLRNVIK